MVRRPLAPRLREPCETVRAWEGCREPAGCLQRVLGAAGLTGGPRGEQDSEAVPIGRGAF